MMGGQGEDGERTEEERRQGGGVSGSRSGSGKCPGEGPKRVWRRSGEGLSQSRRPILSIMCRKDVYNW